MNSSSSNSCFSPKGIGSNESITFDQVQSLLDGSILGSPLPYLFLPLAESFIGALVSTYETPIQFRQAMYHGNVNYNVAAMYHPSALDIWGKKDMQICINEFASEQEKMLHEQVAIAYTFAYNAILAAPKCTNAILDIMENVLQLPMSNVLNHNEPDLGTPWGLAKARVDEIQDYSKTDGWNADGSLAHKRTFIFIFMSCTMTILAHFLPFRSS